MPFEPDVAPVDPATIARFNQPEGLDPSLMGRLGKQMDAAFRTENVVGSALSQETLPDAGLAQTDVLAAALFNKEDFLRPEEKGYSDRFNDANSLADMEAIRRQVKNENDARLAMADGPLPEWLAGTIAAVADPTIFLPIAGPLVRGGRLAATAGSALTVGGSAAGGAGAQELILQGTQRTRTIEESAASVVGAFMLGGILGSAAGTLGRRQYREFAKAVEGTRTQLQSDITTTLRAAGLGELPPPRSGLMDTTAVGRFLEADGSPNFTLPKSRIIQAADRDILNYVGDIAPKRLDDVSKAMATVEALQDRIAKLEADPLLFVTRAAPDIRDKPTLDLLAVLDKSGKPEDAAKAAQIREGAQPAVTLNRLYDQMNEATAEWERAQSRLDKEVKRTKDTLAEIEANLGPKERAQVGLQLSELQEKFLKAIEEGKDPLSLYPKGDPMDWLRGFARFPTDGKPKSNLVKPGEAPKKPESAGAAAVGEHAPASSFLSRLRSSFKVAEITAQLSKVGLAAPALYMATSMFEGSRRAINRIVSTGLMLEDHYRGARSPDDFHTEVKILGGPSMMQVQRIADTAWSDYKSAMKMEPSTPKLTRGQLYQEIATAMTRNDEGPHDIISNAAKAYRVIDKHFADLATQWEVGVFKNPEAVAKANKDRSHLQRVWHMEKMRANPVGFKELAKDWFLRANAEKGADVQEFADEVAESIYHKIMGSSDGRLPPEIKIAEGRGSAKERTFKIPDDWRTADGRYRTSDFVDRNIINVMSRYVRTMSADIAYQKILGGDEGVEVMRKEIKAEASDMLAALSAKADEKMGREGKPVDTSKEATRITKMLERDLNTLEELIHRVRGTDPHPQDPRYAGARSVGKMARDYNVVRVMGSSLISQIPDLGRLAMTEGVIRGFGSIIGDFTDGFKMLKIGIKDGQRVGTVDDMMMGGRAGAIADMSEQYTRQSKAEMFSGMIAHKALMLFGISPWNTWVKGRASYLGADTLLRGAEALATGKPLSETRAAILHQLGIGKYEAELIHGQREHWYEPSRGFLTSAADKWTNVEAQNAFDRALLRYVDGHVITPNAADKPLWTQGEVGKMLTQFQSFGFAAHQRILVAGLQQRDANTLSSIMAMVGLGVTATAIRDLVRDGKVDDKRSASAWVREGVDRSGVLARMMELDAMGDKVSGGHGLAKTLTGEQPSRFAARSLVGQFGGPTAGLVDGVGKALSGAANDRFTGSDLHSIRVLSPLQNFIGTKALFDKVEENLVNQYGLPPRQTAR